MCRQSRNGQETTDKIDDDVPREKKNKKINEENCRCISPGYLHLFLGDLSLCLCPVLGYTSICALSLNPWNAAAVTLILIP